jgi:hypothetical protein
MLKAICIDGHKHRPKQHELRRRWIRFTASAGTSAGNCPEGNQQLVECRRGPADSIPATKSTSSFAVHRIILPIQSNSTNHKLVPSSAIATDGVVVEGEFYGWVRTNNKALEYMFLGVLKKTIFFSGC